MLGLDVDVIVQVVVFVNGVVVDGMVGDMNGSVRSGRIVRWTSLVKGRRIMNLRRIRIGDEVLGMDLICRLNRRYNSILSLKIVNHVIKQIQIHRC